MNSVSVVGEVVEEPRVRVNRAGHDECRIQIAVPRRSRGGRREPGVVYVDVTTFGEEARECERRLREGSRLGLAGRLDSDPPEHGIGILVDQLEFL